MKTKYDGFTLVEIAVVMVVVGLLIGGILQGRELVETTQLNKTYISVESYRVASMQFKNKYNVHAGDMPNAANRIPGCNTTPGCFNAGGNGNDVIGIPAITNWSRTDQGGATTEATQFWVHLALSNLITGVSADNETTWGALYPAAPIRGGFQVFHAAETASVPALGHYFLLRFATTGDPHPDDPSNAPITASQLAYIDRKFDDGLCLSGDILCDSDAVGCTDIATGAYRETTGTYCIAAFKFY